MPETRQGWRIAFVFPFAIKARFEAAYGSFAGKSTTRVTKNAFAERIMRLGLEAHAEAVKRGAAGADSVLQ